MLNMLTVVKPDAWRRVFQLKNLKQRQSAALIPSLGPTEGCLHIFICDPNASLPNRFPFCVCVCVLEYLVAGGPCCSYCQSQHKDGTVRRAKGLTVNMNTLLA